MRKLSKKFKKNQLKQKCNPKQKVKYKQKNNNKHKCKNLTFKRKKSHRKNNSKNQNKHKNRNNQSHKSRSKSPLRYHLTSTNNTKNLQKFYQSIKNSWDHILNMKTKFKTKYQIEIGNICWLKYWCVLWLWSHFIRQCAAQREDCQKQKRKNTLL